MKYRWCRLMVQTAAWTLLVALFTMLSCASSALAAASTDAAPVAVNVEIFPVKSMQMPKEVNSLGSLQAIQEVTITSEVDGRIKSIYFKNGQQVGMGMPILQLDDQTEQADYAKAVSKLNVDASKYRAQQLAGSAIAQLDLENQKALVEQDKTDVSSKQAALAQRQIKASFAGVLGDFQVNAGDFLKAGVPVVKLVNTDQLRAVYHLSQDVVPQLKDGQLAKITVDAYPSRTFYGTVNYISPTVDQTARTVTVQALVKNPQGLLRPGMFIHVAQQIQLQQNALVIPEQALLVDIKGSYVYKIVDNKAVRVGVTVGTRQRGVAQIITGLNLGDPIVVAGQQKLIEGTPVKLVPTLPSVINTMNQAADSEAAAPVAPAKQSTPPAPAAAPNSSGAARTVDVLANIMHPQIKHPGNTMASVVMPQHRAEHKLQHPPRQLHPPLLSAQLQHS